MIKDVRNEFVSPYAAREDYGVVIDGDAVDETATLALRRRMRDARQWHEPPVYSWGLAAK